MSSDAARDLERWIPQLLAVWRRQRRAPKSKGPLGKKGHRPQQGRRPEKEESLDPERLTKDELKDVAQGVRELSLGLTRKRELAGGRYMDDPKLLGAYLLFYWPVSYAQARSVLSELPHRPGSVLDLGAGPGPMSFAALDAGAKDVTAADRSRLALDLARALALEVSEPIGTREWSPEQPLPEGRFDLILMGHVINELFDGNVARRVKLLESILAQVKPNGSLLVVEPALRDTSRALLEVRDVLVASGYAVRAPCLFQGACPALARPTDWCHAERPWRLPRLVESIALAAGLHKEALKMSYLAVAPKGEAWPTPPPGRLFRIVSEPLEGKGRQRFMGCGPEGRIGLAMQEKHVTDGNRLFFKMTRGDVIRIDHTEAKGDGQALDEKSTLEIVASAGRPVVAPTT